MNNYVVRCSVRCALSFVRRKLHGWPSRHDFLAARTPFASLGVGDFSLRISLIGTEPRRRRSTLSHPVPVRWRSGPHNPLRAEGAEPPTEEGSMAWQLGSLAAWRAPQLFLGNTSAQPRFVVPMPCCVGGLLVLGCSPLEPCVGPCKYVLRRYLGALTRPTLIHV